MMDLLQELDEAHCHCPYGAAGKEVGYSCPGTSLDWIYDKLKTPYSFAFEIFVGNDLAQKLKDEKSHSAALLQQGHLAHAVNFFQEHPSDFVQLSSADQQELFHSTVKNWVSVYLEMAQKIAKNLQKDKTGGAGTTCESHAWLRCSPSRALARAGVERCRPGPRRVEVTSPRVLQREGAGPLRPGKRDLGENARYRPRVVSGNGAQIDPGATMFGTRWPDRSVEHLHWRRNCRRLATEDEASIHCGGALPLADPANEVLRRLKLQLVEAAADTAEYDEERRSSAKGLVASLQRQLGDPWTCSVGDGPDLRTSGLGPDRDGEVRILSYEQISPRRQTSMVAATASECVSSWSRPGVVPERALAPPPRDAGGVGAEKHTVPKLHLRSSGPLALPTDGLGAAFAALFSWMPGCSTSLCRAEPTDTVRVGTMPQAAPFDTQVEGKAEAGLGGWPLSLPEVHVAFLNASDLRKSAPSLAASPGTSPRPSGTEGPPEFQRAAIELDEDELVLLCPALLKSVLGGTPSTASSKVSDAWPAPGRLVCPRAGLSRMRGLRAQELNNAPTPHVLEFEVVSGATYLAFSTCLACEAAQTAKYGLYMTGSFLRPCNGVRCELRINAQLRLESNRDFQNCAAVVRRGICEATHVSAERVLVQRIWMESSNFDA
eukprot:g11540.t1